VPISSLKLGTGDAVPGASGTTKCPSSRSAQVSEREDTMPAARVGQATLFFGPGGRDPDPGVADTPLERSLPRSLDPRAPNLEEPELSEVKNQIENRPDPVEEPRKYCSNGCRLLAINESGLCLYCVMGWKGREAEVVVGVGAASGSAVASIPAPTPRHYYEIDPDDGQKSLIPRSRIGMIERSKWK
jgi:hypothetical protein